MERLMSKTVYDYMDWPEIEAVVYGEETAPRDVMGPRLTPDGVLIQGFFPEARAAAVVTGRTKYEMELEDEAGYYAVLIPGRRIPDYEFQVEFEKETKNFKDAYAFGGLLTEEDERAFLGGVYYEAYKKMGAHPMVMNGVAGTHFAVWAPNAVRVSVVGEFNNWDGRALPMHKMPMSGLFELFIPGVKAGDAYRYEIKAKGDVLLQKADPYGNRTQPAPLWNSVVADVSDFTWNDSSWMAERKKYDDRRQPVSIYETSLGQWESGKELVTFAKEKGYTHVELHPVMEFLEDGSDGYPTSAYFAVSTRYGTPAEFAALVDELHQVGIGVILDWSPAQFPRYAGGLEKFDGTALYEVKDSEMAVHPMWGTMLYNYDSPMVMDFLISNACFWLEVFHVDGLRMDDVDAMLYLDYGKEDGQWVPNIYGGNKNLEAIEFFKHINTLILGRNPGVVMIAEESTAWPKVTGPVEEDGLNFSYKWNMGWMHDFLDYMKLDPYFRKDNHNKMTFAMSYNYSEKYILVLSHDEVVHLKCSMLNKMPGLGIDKYRNLMAGYAFMMGHPGKKLLFMGQDFGQLREWSEKRELDWELLNDENHSHLQAFVKELLTIYKKYPAMYELDDQPDGFEWINPNDGYRSIFSFVRHGKSGRNNLLFVCNFTPMARPDYRVGVPKKKKYTLLLNSDDAKFGGEGTERPTVYQSEKSECDGRPYSFAYELPPYGVAIFKF